MSVDYAYLMFALREHIYHFISCSGNSIVKCPPGDLILFQGLDSGSSREITGELCAVGATG